MLEEILKSFGVPLTAALASYWKDKAKSKENWHELTITQGKRDKDLIKDNLYQLFYTPAIAKEAELRLDKRMWLPLATRTRYFRRTVSEAIKTQGIQQVLILGSGFDTLAVRKSKYTTQYGVKFFEIDKPEILECKNAIFEANDLDKNAKYLGLDYTKEDFIARLKELEFNQELPTLVLWEGNSFYLDKNTVKETLAVLAKSFPHLVLSFDFMHEEIQKESKTLDSFAKRQSPFKSFFNVDEIIEICKQLELNCQTHFNTAELAKLYEVDETPYHTAEPYSVITFNKGM